MERDNVLKFADNSVKKRDFLKKSPVKYIIYSMMAGLYVGLGIVLIFSIGAPLYDTNFPLLKALMGASFAIALTLVIFAGSELFTGNNMTMIIGNLEKRVRWYDTAKVWVFSYFGNLAGAVMLALLMAGTGLLSTNPLNTFLIETVSHKMTAPFSELFFKGVLCNILVCLAVWSSSKVKSETAKLILIFWCLFGFIGSGFEHSVANMSLLAMGIFAPHTDAAVNWSGYINNLIPVTLGNIVGGSLFIALGYWFVSKRSSAGDEG